MVKESMHWGIKYQLNPTWNPVGIHLNVYSLSSLGDVALISNVNFRHNMGSDILSIQVNITLELKLIVI